MTKYTVTTELRTPWYKTFFRFLSLIEDRQEFDILVRFSDYNVGDVLSSGQKKIPIKVIKKIEDGSTK